MCLQWWAKEAGATRENARRIQGRKFGGTINIKFLKNNFEGAATALVSVVDITIHQANVIIANIVDSLKNTLASSVLKIK